MLILDEQHDDHHRDCDDDVAGDRQDVRGEAESEPPGKEPHLPEAKARGVKKFIFLRKKKIQKLCLTHCRRDRQGRALCSGPLRGHRQLQPDQLAGEEQGPAERLRRRCHEKCSE